MRIPHHVAIILDGNGRWAKKRLMPRSLGHYYGGRNLFKIANIACNLGIKELSVYAFSTENWNRSEEEVTYLMTKPVEMFESEAKKLNDVKYKISFQGRKDRVPSDLLEVMKKMEDITKDNQDMVLNICFDYGAFDELITAINNITGVVNIENLYENLMIKTPVDLLIRTSGEQRLSNFLLLQASYAELYFTKIHWPAFNEKTLKKALKAYNKRDRRFGKA